MNQLLETILNAQGGDTVNQLAKQFGLNSGQANSILSQVVPALAGGVKQNVSQNGVDGLLSALNKGNHQRYLDQTAQLSNQDTTNDGNAILGHILGSKDVSREVASRASTNTGLDSGIVKKMLPVIATMVMGGLSKQTSSGGALSFLMGGSQQSSGVEGLLTSFLDADGDGSIADDLIGKLF